MGKLAAEAEILINETQDLVLSGFSTEGKKINLPNWVENIKIVAETPDDLVKSTLGMTGQRLKRFAIRTNLDHPDLESYFSSLGNPAIEVFRQAADLLSAAKADKDAGKGVVDIEKNFLAKEKCQSTVRLLQTPAARLLVGMEDRKNQREIKKQVKSVGLKTILQTGSNAENNFFGRPEHFKRFARSSKFYHEELKELQKRQQLFAAKNMNEMAHTYVRRMRALEESISDTLGFYRIKPDEAAVTLARLHGFKWSDSGHITVRSNYYEGCHFWAEGAMVIEEDKIESMKKAIILNTRFIPTGIGTANFNYQARMYPLAHFPLSLPEKAQKIIDLAEHMTNLNNSPFFDYYWVLIPSISLNHQLIQKQKDHWTIRENGVNTIYTDVNEADLNLDKILVKEGYAVPIIIGERDGKCYFVSMFV